MLNDAFDAVTGNRGPDLCPADLKPAMDDLNRQGLPTVCRSRRLRGGRAAAHGTHIPAAMDQLFGFLDELDGRLSGGRRFCLGERPTLADVLVYATLVRFDAVYNPLFARAAGDSLVDYPHLPGGC